jgi:Arc/MetJ-type ribon-helix-helix transcriptional regulator
MKNDMVTIRLSRWDLERINQAIRKGFFNNRSDFVRSAVRKMADELDNVPKAVLEMIEESTQRGLTMEHVRKASKDAGRTAHSRKCKQ